MVLMLDLGRPDRLIVAATNYNAKSVFAWNVFLYSGMAAIVVVYLWTIMERRMNVLEGRGTRSVPVAAGLTTGTGAIFGVPGRPRRLRHGAPAAPVHRPVARMGLAVFLLAQGALYGRPGRTPLPLSSGGCAPAGRVRGRRALLRVRSHLTNAYFAQAIGFERFILLDGGVYPLVFWLGLSCWAASFPWR